jgi:hypothetical protein
MHPEGHPRYTPPRARRNRTGLEEDLGRLPLLLDDDLALESPVELALKRLETDPEPHDLGGQFLDRPFTVELEVTGFETVLLVCCQRPLDPQVLLIDQMELQCP